MTVEFQKKRTPMEVEQLVLDEDGDSLTLKFGTFYHFDVHRFIWNNLFRYIVFNHLLIYL